MKKNWMAKVSALLGLVLIALLVISCSGGGGGNNGGNSGGGVVNIAGAWSGTWAGIEQGTGPVNGDWSANITQNGNQISGTLVITGPDYPEECANGNFTGSVNSNNSVSFGLIFNTGCENYNWNGTVSADGNSMTGNYASTDSTATGTFSGSRGSGSSGPKVGPWSGNYFFFEINPSNKVVNLKWQTPIVHAEGTGCATDASAYGHNSGPLGVANSRFSVVEESTVNGVFTDTDHCTISFSKHLITSLICPSAILTLQDTVVYTPGGACNVEFCRQQDNYQSGFGVPSVDKITIVCISGPTGATVSNQMNGEYMIKGTYKLGSFSNAEIQLNWGGTPTYSSYTSHVITSPGSGAFMVKVNKVSGGSGNLYLSMISGTKWMFDATPYNDCTPSPPAQ